MFKEAEIRQFMPKNIVSRCRCPLSTDCMPRASLSYKKKCIHQEALVKGSFAANNTLANMNSWIIRRKFVKVSLELLHVLYACVDNGPLDLV